MVILNFKLSKIWTRAKVVRFLHVTKKGCRIQNFDDDDDKDSKRCDR